MRETLDDKCLFIINYLQNLVSYEENLSKGKPARTIFFFDIVHF